MSRTILLDLATVYAERGDTTELERLASELVPIFASRDESALWRRVCRRVGGQ